jgi:hypothetical protein
MKLSKEVDETIVTFTEKLRMMCQSLEGAGTLPYDISAIITNAMSSSTVSKFYIEMTRHHNQLNIDPGAMTYNNFLVMAMLFYRMLKEQGEWMPAKQQQNQQAQFLLGLVPMNNHQPARNNAEFCRQQPAAMTVTNNAPNTNNYKK